MTDAEQLIAQARAAHAKAMNCSDLASEGAWVAHETVNGLPPNNYWAVTATRTPTTKGVDPFTVWKAHVNTPAMAGLLTFISTALPQLCDLADAGLSASTASPLGGPPGELDEPIPSSPPCGMGPSDLDAGLGAEPSEAWAKLTPDQRRDVEAHINGLTSDAETYNTPRRGWTCFHCGETFRTDDGARLHFGEKVTGRPACVHEAIAKAIDANIQASFSGHSGWSLIGHRKASDAILEALGASTASPAEQSALPRETK